MLPVRELAGNQSSYEGLVGDDLGRVHALSGCGHWLGMRWLTWGMIVDGKVGRMGVSALDPSDAPLDLGRTLPCARPFDGFRANGLGEGVGGQLSGTGSAGNLRSHWQRPIVISLGLYEIGGDSLEDVRGLFPYAMQRGTGRMHR